MRQAKTTRDIALFTFAALGVRLVWVFWRSWVAGDSPDYLTIARNIRFHHLFSLTESAVGPFLPTAFRPPLYPAFIALLWLNDSPPIKLILVYQAFMGAATVALVYLSAGDRFGRQVASLAASFMIVAPMTGYFTAVILTETLFTFLLMSAVFSWGRGRSLLTGLAFGLAALTRPTVLPFLIVIPAISLLPRCRGAWRKHLLILLAAAAISSTWIVRNAVVFGRFIPITSSGWGMNLLYGTLDTELIGIRVWTGSEWVLSAGHLPESGLVNTKKSDLFQVDSGLSETERDRVFFQRGIQRIKERPLHWMLVRVEQYPKLFLDSGDYVLGSYNVPIREAFAHKQLMVLTFKLLFVGGNLAALVLAAWGFWSVRKRWSELVHLVSFPLFLLVMQIPMWTESRYTIPIVPVLAIFASVGLHQLWKQISRRSWRLPTGSHSAT